MLVCSPSRDCSDPKRDGGPNLADANDIEAGPLDPHLVQASLDLESDLELLDVVELLIGDDPKLLDLAVSFRVLRLLPQSGAGAL